MFCCGLDPTLAAWLAQADERAEGDDLRLLPLVFLIVTSLGLALAAVFLHP